MRSFVSALSALLLATVCSSCGIADGASNSTVVRASSDVPETLSAAVAAAQANADRFSAGDFAGVWHRMSHEVRDKISQDDFVTFYETCKKAGPTIRVDGVSLDAAAGTAVVRMDVGDTEQPRIMLFEDGTWVMKPTPGFAAHLGQPVAQIVAEEKSAGLCPN
ncbi:MAG: hypothetical protein JWP55_4625 [Mycobacterium sp.]|jgi:hypothetical protein|nr:hypothetical protein [Mycobacterium sp.]